MYLPVCGILFGFVVSSLCEVTVYPKEYAGSNNFNDSVIDDIDSDSDDDATIFKGTKQIAGINIAFQPESLVTATSQDDVRLKSTEMDWLYNDIRMWFLSLQPIQIDIKKSSNEVRINGEKACEGAENQKPCYQKSQCGVIWFTNCQVGKKVEGDELKQVKEKLNKRARYYAQLQGTSTSTKKAQGNSYRGRGEDDSLADEKTIALNLCVAWKQSQRVERVQSFEQFLRNEIKKTEEKRQLYRTLLNKRHKCGQHIERGPQVGEKYGKLENDRHKRWVIPIEEKIITEETTSPPQNGICSKSGYHAGTGSLETESKPVHEQNVYKHGKKPEKELHTSENHGKTTEHEVHSSNCKQHTTITQQNNEQNMDEKNKSPKHWEHSYTSVLHNFSPEKGQKTLNPDNAAKKQTQNLVPEKTNSAKKECRSQASKDQDTHVKSNNSRPNMSRATNNKNNAFSFRFGSIFGFRK